MKLYGYFRPSASYRVRIALNLKQIEVEAVSWMEARGERIRATMGAEAKPPSRGYAQELGRDQEQTIAFWAICPSQRANWA